QLAQALLDVVAGGHRRAHRTAVQVLGGTDGVVGEDEPDGSDLVSLHDSLLRCTLQGPAGISMRVFVAVSMTSQRGVSPARMCSSPPVRSTHFALKAASGRPPKSA